jgi:hypothetical protein
MTVTALLRHRIGSGREVSFEILISKNQYEDCILKSRRDSSLKWGVSKKD